MQRPVIAALIAALVTLTISSSAAADAGTVRYSYEKVEIDTTTQWVLIPKAEISLKGKPTATHIKRAFTLLKKAKRGTYGGSAIIVKGNNPATAKVTVNISPKVSKYSLIIIAETVFTLTELGVKGVDFPGYTTGPMSREDVPFPHYALQVPLWRAIPSLSTPHAQVVFPDGSIHPSTEVAAKWRNKDPELVKALYSYLNAKDAYTVTNVAKALPTLKVPYAEQVAALLKDSRAAVRETALEVLEPERNNTVVADAAVAFLKAEKDAKLAAKGAEFLGKVKDKKYNIQKPLYYLEKGDEKASLAAAKELAGYKDERVVPALADHLTDKRLKVAFAAAESLEKVNAAAAQEKALKDSKVNADVRLQIARDLSEDKTVPQKIAGLNYLVLNAKEDEGTKAIVAMNSVKDDAARTTLESYITSDTRWTRRTTADELVNRGDVKSAAAFSRAIKSKKDAEYMEKAGYELMVKQPLKVVLEQTNVKDANVKRAAYSAVGERAQKEKKANAKTFKVLTDGLKSRDPLIRGACARAIGVFADKRAATALKTVISDKSDSVRADVATGMGNFKGAELLEELTKYLEDSSAEVQAAAVTSLGKRGEAGKWDKFKALAKHKSPAVRAAAMTTLARLVSRDDKQGVREVISLLSGGVTDDDLSVRIASVTALGTFKDDKAVTGIALQLNADEEDMRLAAIAALGETGHPSAKELVLSVANDPDKKVRREAIIAMGKLGATPLLKDRAKNEKDADLQALINQTLRGK